MPKKRTAENEMVSAAAAAAAPARRKPAVARKKHAASAPASPQTKAAEPAAVEPSPEEIAKLAYFYWEARGRQDGSAEEDWLRAELELRSR